MSSKGYGTGGGLADAARSETERRKSEHAAYRKGVESGTLKSATPNAVRGLLDDIDRLEARVEWGEALAAAVRSFEKAHEGPMTREVVELIDALDTYRRATEEQTDVE